MQAQSADDAVEALRARLAERVMQLAPVGGLHSVPGELAGLLLDGALAPLVQREILYRLLVGEAGGRLRQIATVHQIARAIGRLKDMTPSRCAWRNWRARHA